MFLRNDTEAKTNWPMKLIVDRKMSHYVQICEKIFRKKIGNVVSIYERSK